MKAISLWQPWATLIAIGVKKYETRSWAPPRALLGQRIAIHAAKKDVPLDQIQGAAHRIAITTELLSRDILELPVGAIVCTAILQSWFQCVATIPPTPPLDLFGNYEPGRFAWKLTDVQTFPPIPCRGRQGFFNAPEVLG